MYYISTIRGMLAAHTHARMHAGTHARGERYRVLLITLRVPVEGIVFGQVPYKVLMFCEHVAVLVNMPFYL